ncbi:MAG: ATP-binding protein [Thermodesulfobacteriota bacterium]
MPRASLSIRRKLLISIGALYVFMAASILGSYYFMHLLEEKIAYLEDISKLEESVLEIRRFEKNYFLYADLEALGSAAYHVQRAKNVVARNFGRIESLSSPQQASTFQKDLEAYGRLIKQCTELASAEQCPQPSPARQEYEREIRKTGSAISEFAEAVARRKRLSIAQIMGATVRLQLLAFALVATGLLGVSVFLTVKVIRPLRLLEDSTHQIAKGKFEPITDFPPEAELRNIFEAFNSMAAELKVREEQLVESKKLASLGTMLAGVAHEVNNPLSNISSSCEILLEEIDDGDKEFHKDVLKRVVDQVDKARSIILNLLEFSRTSEFLKEPVEVKNIVENSLRLLQGQIPTNVEVTIDVPDDITIFADKQRIQQAFMNLISNAIQAIKGTGAVTIRALGSRDGYATIIVQDNGVGISHDDLPRIFDPFFTTKDVGKGTGLGLFITHDIIVRHQGTIKVDSAPGLGTSFVVRLPSRELFE